MAGRPQPQTAVAGALCLVLSLLCGRAAAQGTPVQGPTQGSAELSMHLVERMKAKQKEPTLNDYYLSARRDFGVQHCLLQGILPFNNESTLLPPTPEDPEDPQACKHLADLSRPGHKIAYHLLVRMVVSNGTAYVRGITSLEPIGRHFVSFHYLSQSYFFQQFKQELWLGSQRTGKKYGPLLISKVRWFQWEKWHLWGETVSRIHFQPIPLLPEDAEAPEFELYSEYFPYTCFIVPAHDQPMGTLMSKATRPVKLQPHLVPPHAYPRVIFLTSGFFLLSPIWGTKMLTWHMAWHKQYGVDLYVMYMQMEVLHLLEQPVIQELIQDGELSVISWDVMPGLATPMFSKETEHSCVDNVGYWNQIFLYNHFLIAMWLEDVIVIVADVDEWLMTPKPKTIHTMLMDCAPEAVNQPLAFLSIVRRIGWCKGCGVTENGTTAEVEYWMNFNVSTTPPEQHPIRKYVLGTWDDPIKPKSIYIPALTLSVDPHVGQVVEGSASRSHPTECAYFMHMTTLFINRHYGWDHRNEGTPDEIFLGQFWPSHHNHTGPNILTTKY